MTEHTPAPRCYTDQEVRRLLERATELQRTEPGPTSDASGLTLSELESIAGEAGIDRSALRRAAAELESGGETGGGIGEAMAGAPVRVVLEQTLPVEVPADDLGVVVPLIQTAADATGQASMVGQTLTWQATTEGAVRRFQVTITTRAGETRVRIEERYGDLAGAIFGGGLGGIGGGVGFGVGMGVGAAIGSTVMMVGFPILAMGLTYAGSRLVYGRIVHRRRQTLDRLMAELAEALMEAGSDPDQRLDAGTSPALPDGT